MGTTVLDVVRAAIPGADEALADHVLWGRTCYPFGKFGGARGVFKAAHRLKRAADKGARLCEWCNRIAMAGKWTCEGCDAALSAQRGGE